MKRFLGIVLGSTLTVASVAAADPGQKPRVLLDGELDIVSAGVDAQAIALALGSGDATLTSTNTAALVSATEGPAPGIYSTTGAAGGAAYGFAVGEDAAIATAVATQSTAEGRWTRTDTANWTVQRLGASVSGGFTHSVGNTGAWIFGGP
jgi:hypothetical protein